MVTGAGGGREVFALLKMGYNVDSSECHPELAASANNLLKKQGLSNRVMLADRDVVPDTENSYDGLIVGWGSYMLIQGRKRRIAFLRQMRTRVKPGSPLMVSFFHRKHEERKFRVTCLLGNIFRNILGADPLEMGDALRPNYVHFFTVDEIRQELQEAGFKLAFYDTHIYGHAIGLASEEYSACDG
jgi:hypothetical protein